MEVEMKIRGLTMDPMTQMPIVVLKDVNGGAVLPIWVGIFEANAIALEIEKVSTPRPMTHDLIKTVLMGLNTGVRKVVVNELKDDTFYALIWLERGVAPLVDRGGRAVFVIKAWEQAATPEDIARLRSFQKDLQSALA